MHPFRTLTLIVGLVAVGSASPRELRAQFPAEIQVGARVRAWLPEAHPQSEGPRRRQMLRGFVESTTADTLLMTIPGAVGTVAISRATLRRLEVSRGPSRGLTAAERAIGGAMGGAITWAFMNDPRRSGGPNYRTDWRAAGVGAAWGAGIGALTGILFPHEHWKRVRLR